ncbi:hypothetical protein RDI58_024297 [Solanum bulbocastanum]|uniref:Uncharacterized protein n=1 Tax=Solanum bulbocastanum TaxID=147425 RepID=A0AAN8Y367_SOLBU
MRILFYDVEVWVVISNE